MNHNFFQKACRLAAAAVLSVFFMAGEGFSDAPKLPPCGASPAETSVSGLSSGAFMATQFHVAFSDMVMGAGIVAGGPFYCAGSYSSNSYLENAVNICLNPMGRGPDGMQLFAKAKEFAGKGLIDDPANLADDRVYLFSSPKDRTVSTKVVDETEKFYKLAGVPEESIRYAKTPDAGHGMITDREGAVPCRKTAPPYINDCDFFQSHDILKHICGELNPPAQSLSGDVIRFDQKEFADTERVSMGDHGYVYVPRACEEKTCKIHIVFHGCGQGADLIGDKYYATTGYNEMADSNDIIVLYPQAKPSDVNPYNPKGCWDFWGYASPDPKNPDFYAKTSPQMSAVMKMADRLAEPRKAAKK